MDLKWNEKSVFYCKRTLSLTQIGCLELTKGAMRRRMKKFKQKLLVVEKQVRMFHA